MEDGLLSAEQFSTATLRRVLDPSLKPLAAALLIALAFLLAAAGRPQGTPTDGIVDYFKSDRMLRARHSNPVPAICKYCPTPSHTDRASACCYMRSPQARSSRIEDNFFDLGGYSLLATQVVSRIRSAFAIDLPLWNCLHRPRIVEIAAIFDRNRVKHTSDIASARIYWAKWKR